VLFGEVGEGRRFCHPGLRRLWHRFCASCAAQSRRGFDDY